MTDTAIDLIERLEKATEGNRELDARIHAAKAGCPFSRLEGRVLFLRLGDGSEVTDMSWPHYTTSIDAALTLVPEGRYGRVWFGDFKTYRNDEFGASMWSPDTTKKASMFGPAGTGATPALSLCIAALRAQLPDRSE